MVDTKAEVVEAMMPLVTNAQIGDCTNVEVLKSMGELHRGNLLSLRKGKGKGHAPDSPAVHEKDDHDPGSHAQLPGKAGGHSDAYCDQRPDRGLYQCGGIEEHRGWQVKNVDPLAGPQIGPDIDQKHHHGHGLHASRRGAGASPYKHEHHGKELGRSGKRSRVYGVKACRPCRHGAGEYSSFVSFCGDILINVVLMALVVVGGIGFFVWDDLRKNRLRFRERFRKGFLFPDQKEGQTVWQTSTCVTGLVVVDTYAGWFLPNFIHTFPHNPDSFSSAGFFQPALFSLKTYALSCINDGR